MWLQMLKIYQPLMIANPQGRLAGLRFLLLPSGVAFPSSA